MNITDFQELERLRKENEELKEVIKEGIHIFNYISDFIGLKKAAMNHMLLAKIPFLIRKVQDNPDLIEQIMEYINKIKKYENA